MSTGHTPNPPQHLTTQATTQDTKGQAAGVAEEQAAAVEEALPLPADMARILEEQIDAISQRMVYHSQMMYSVSGMGTDPVSARTATMVIANALRNGSSDMIEHALVNLADPVLTQVNDATIPSKIHSQIAGLFEGILIDTVVRAYIADPARAREARTLLESLFQPANQALQLPRPKATAVMQVPGPDPNARI